MKTKEIISLRTPQTKYPILPVMAKRFSPRIFSKQSIPNREIEIIMEAARLAPSARFNQPWMYFVAFNGTEGFDRLISCIPERNHWCKTAPVLILTTYNPSEPIDGINKWAQYDLGAANYAIVLQAQELGYYTRQIGSFDIDKAKLTFTNEIAEPYLPFVILAIGRIGSDGDYNNADKVFVDKDLIPPVRKEKIYQII